MSKRKVSVADKIYGIDINDKRVLRICRKAFGGF